MKTIRQSLFETNSSAMHSIVYVDAIDQDNSFDKKRYNAVKNVYTIKYLDPYDGDDERGILTTPKEKIDYLMTHAGTQFTNRDITDFLNSKKDLKAGTDIDLCTIETVRNVVREQFKDCKFKIINDFDDYAEIDSEAYDTVRDFIKDKELNDHDSICAELRKVILDPNYFIILTHDGYPYFKYDDETEETYLDLPKGYVREPVVESDKVMIKNGYAYIGYVSDDKFYERVYGVKDIFEKLNPEYTLDDFETIIIAELRKDSQERTNLINKDTAKEFFRYGHLNFKYEVLIKIWKTIYKYKSDLDENSKK